MHVVWHACLLREAHLPSGRCSPHRQWQTEFTLTLPTAMSDADCYEDSFIETILLCISRIAFELLSL